MKLTNKVLPISALRMSNYNWKREVTDEDVEDLAENMEEIGNLHPIIARPVGKAGQMYEVLAGRRRLAAQRHLGYKKVDVRVVKCNDIDAEIISYSENLKVKKPSTREWSRGAKRLVDLFEQKYKIGTLSKQKKQKKSEPSEKKPNLVAATKLGPPPRVKTSRGLAVTDTAKILGASEVSVRRAAKREGDLIPTALRALDLGTITQEQADILARMSVADQQANFPEMVKETRNETRRRRNVEKVLQRDDKDKVVLDMFSSVLLDCRDLDRKLDSVIRALEKAEIKPKRLKQVAHHQQAENARDSLDDLLELMRTRRKKQ